MAMAVAHQHRESSSDSINRHLDAGKYVRYTGEQVEALERVYAECLTPSSLQSQVPREATKRGFSAADCEQENDGDEQAVDGGEWSVAETGVTIGMREWFYAATTAHFALATTDASCESMVTTTQHSMRDANNPAGADSSAAKMAQSKLGENMKKLQVFSTAVAFEAEDVNQAVSAACKAFDQGPWPKMERSRIMLRFADLLEKHSDHIAALETWDNGKPYEQAANEEITLVW
ncbi:unnamed protein product [Camellia sinensis]